MWESQRTEPYFNIDLTSEQYRALKENTKLKLADTCLIKSRILMALQQICSVCKLGLSEKISKSFTDLSNDNKVDPIIT